MSFPCPLPLQAPDRNTLQSFQVRERHPPTSVLPLRLVAHAPFLLCNLHKACSNGTPHPSSLYPTAHWLRQFSILLKCRLRQISVFPIIGGVHRS